jgi:hypothetical protein
MSLYQIGEAIKEWDQYAVGVFLVWVADRIEGCSFTEWVPNLWLNFVLEKGFDSAGCAALAGMHEDTFSVFVTYVVDVGWLFASKLLEVGQEPYVFMEIGVGTFVRYNCD